MARLNGGSTGGGGTSDHAALSNLDFASAGHTGFEPAKGADENYVSDAQLTVIQNTSGTNTGDQDLSGLATTELDNLGTVRINANLWFDDSQAGVLAVANDTVDSAGQDLTVAAADGNGTDQNSGTLVLSAGYATGAGTMGQVAVEGGDSNGARRIARFDPSDLSFTIMSPFEVNEPILNFEHDSDNVNLFNGDVAGRIGFVGKGDDAAFHEYTRIWTEVTEDAGAHGRLVISVDTGAGLQEMMYFSPGSIMVMPGIANYVQDDGNGLHYIELSDSSNLRLGSVSADQSSGITALLETSEAFGIGDVGYIDANGLVTKADATTSATAPATVMCLETQVGAGVANFLLHGIVDLSTLNPNWAVGAMVYLDTSAGSMTTTAPSNTGEIVQILGVVYPPAIAGTPPTSNTLYFNPQLVTVEIA